MKYQNLKAFQKHVTTAAPDHLCDLYLICVADDFERAQVFDFLCSSIPSLVERYSAEETSLLDCVDSMQNMNLFGSALVIIDRVEKFSKKEQQTLLDQLVYPAGKVLLGASTKISSIASFVEEKGVVLDLLAEKPWEKEKRISDELFARAMRAKKKISPDVISLLFERLGVDPCLLQNELDKLICFTGDKPQIDREDVLCICFASKGSSHWQIAESVVWEEGEFHLVDVHDFHGILVALRSQLHLGLSLASLIKSRRPSEEWGRFLPKIWPKTLEKRSSQAARLGPSYFEKGLSILLDIELLSRSGSTQYTSLLQLFKAKIHGRSLSSSQSFR